MKQPLMLIPPAQAEVLSDNHWADLGRENAHGEDRFGLIRWLDDDLPDEAASPAGAPPGEQSRILAPTRMRAA